MTKKALLPYGTEPSFPAIEMTYTVEWDGHLAGKARDTLTAKAEAIKSDYEALTNLAKDTEFVNAIPKRFDVKVGEVYWVYENKLGDLFISIIEPYNWTPSTQPSKYIGQFRLSPDGTWIRESKR